MICKNLMGEELFDAVNTITEEARPDDIIAYDVMSNHCDLVRDGYNLRVDFNDETHAFRLCGDITTEWGLDPWDLLRFFNALAWCIADLPFEGEVMRCTYSTRVWEEIDAAAAM